MGECGCAAASLWLGHAPSIGLAIGPRQRYTFSVTKMLSYIVSNQSFCAGLEIYWKATRQRLSI